MSGKRQQMLEKLADLFDGNDEMAQAFNEMVKQRSVKSQKISPESPETTKKKPVVISDSDDDAAAADSTSEVEKAAPEKDTDALVNDLKPLVKKYNAVTAEMTENNKKGKEIKEKKDSLIEIITESMEDCNVKKVKVDGYTLSTSEVSRASPLTEAIVKQTLSEHFDDDKVKELMAAMNQKKTKTVKMSLSVRKGK